MIVGYSVVAAAEERTPTAEERTPRL